MDDFLSSCPGLIKVGVAEVTVLDVQCAIGELRVLLRWLGSFPQFANDRDMQQRAVALHNAIVLLSASVEKPVTKLKRKRE